MVVTEEAIFMKSSRVDNALGVITGAVGIGSAPCNYGKVTQARIIVLPPVHIIP